ncbi:MAG TPA: DUF1259 domain-containing protein, partial [Gemmatimonadales bacterium]|nr:DUF1259 domain-containing protein [Gemmatimonadales bacterium]
MSVLITAARRAAILAILSGSATARMVAQSPSWDAVDQAIGRAGSPQPGGVQKYSFPRSDLHVTAAGVSIKPALALGGWVAFKAVGGAKEVMAMGDLVLLESEVAPVMSKLQSLGVEQTALHNHLQHETPAVMYLHIRAHGDPVKIAQAVREALALTKTPSRPPAPAAAGVFELDTARLASTLGYPGKVTGGVYQVSVPRADPIRMNGQEVPPAMGVATAINFQPTGGGKAAITGDFVLTADEVNLVIRALRDGGVDVTALHSHMLDEEPRLFFMHFWADDDALA